MHGHQSSGRTGGDKEAILSNVSLLYYGEGLTQGEIAKRLQVSRATVVNMLREARERGIVDIRVGGNFLSGSGLSRELKQKFDLVDVYVSLTDNAQDASGDRKLLLPQLARVAATAIVDVIEPGDRVGVAWGETIMTAADAMSVSPTPDVEVCQLIGSMMSERIPASESCTIQIANKLGASCYTLHTPAILSTEELAGLIRKEPTIRAQLDRLNKLDMTVAAVGNLDPDTHFQVAGMATKQEIAAARAAGAKAILCCRYIDENGNSIDLPPTRRVIAADIETLKRARKKLLAVCGADRVEATMAAIKGGLVTHLCVDKALGEALLRD